MLHLKQCDDIVAAGHVILQVQVECDRFKHDSCRALKDILESVWAEGKLQ